MPPTSEPLDKRFLDVIADYGQDGYSVGSFRGILLALVPLFDRLNIDYAFTDTLAMRLHGGMPTHQGCNVRGLITSESWDRLQTTGDAELNIRRREGEVLVTRRDYQGSFRVCESIHSLSETIYGVRVVTLPHLLAELLPSRRRDTQGEVIRLIQSNHLDQFFADRLPDELRNVYRRRLKAAQTAKAK